MNVLARSAKLRRLSYNEAKSVVLDSEGFTKLVSVDFS